MKCKFDCIFDGNKLYGDCRVPESKECAMHRIDTAVRAYQLSPNSSSECYSLRRIMADVITAMDAEPTYTLPEVQEIVATAVSEAVNDYKRLYEG